MIDYKTPKIIEEKGLVVEALIRVYEGEDVAKKDPLGKDIIEYDRTLGKVAEFTLKPEPPITQAEMHKMITDKLGIDLSEKTLIDEQKPLVK